ncbi:flagellar protein FlbD [Caloramator quimbayensis]|uniref:Flagellar protein FlbD n=1 Tax=Caloramator quimbayensis TaxID=1147123 RepID=A0A1T4XAE3_9CLOT|nr:flagellar FlbD family protein [Caloramator quimbayensis]SKA86407.1 flagellar protein FlbD [Caloramator quimbayensis]
MIKLTGFNHKPFFINNELIEKIESTPDTVVTLTSGKKFVVIESPEEIISRIVDFKRKYTLENPEVIK